MISLTSYHLAIALNKLPSEEALKELKQIATDYQLFIHEDEYLLVFSSVSSTVFLAPITDYLAELGLVGMNHEQDEYIDYVIYRNRFGNSVIPVGKAKTPDWIIENKLMNLVLSEEDTFDLENIIPMALGKEVL